VSSCAHRRHPSGDRVKRVRLKEDDMPKVITFPGIRQGALSCVWIETGNPKQPLARIWVDRKMRFALNGATNQEEAHPCCA
jgi:hypothetical protein